ncbi:MAG: class I tRNA ligase family protein, partial [Planctomycetota bacterium]
MDYRDTLNLPRTDFPMKANLKEKEEQIQKFWEENKIYEKILEKNRNRPKAILHDGPPYANGEPHIGTAFGKVLKDMVNRFNLFTGFYAYFKPGWDCHGQPIELKALDELNINDLSKIDKLTIRKKCEEFALKYVDLQRSLFKRFGIFADWDNAYLTLSRDYEAKVIEMFKLLYEKGYIYRALKPIYWCKSCKTALAEAEVEYSNLPSPSIYVLFPFTAKSINTLENLLNKTIKRCGIVIWTTTPWTLPGNLAVTLHPEFNYVLVKTILDNESCYLLLVKDLVEIVFGKLNLKIEEVIDLKTSWLDNLEYIHPIESHLNGKILFDDYVSREE